MYKARVDALAKVVINHLIPRNAHNINPRQTPKSNSPKIPRNSNNPIHITDKIIELLNKPGLLEKVSKNAYNYVRENFSYENLGIMAKNNKRD